MARVPSALAAALLLALCAGPGEAASVTYRQGDGKGAVSQTDDTRLDETAPTANFSVETTCWVDQSAHQHCVLKFPNIFGDSANQVPPGSQIQSATLTLYVSDSSVDCPIVYQLTEGWTEAEATWNERMTGLAWASPGAEGAASHKAVSEGILPCLSAGTTGAVDVTGSVQRWSEGEPNEGWVLVNPPNNNGTAFATSESATLARRPELAVSFVPTVSYSVGIDSGNLATGSPTMTISGPTATLSVPQSGDVGVGDVIDYGPSQLVYISSVISSTQFTVQGADGSPPPAVGGASVNGIRRAFNSIAAAVAGSSDAVHLNTSNLAGTSRKLHWVLYNDGPFDVFSTASITGYTTAPDYDITLTAAGAWQVASGNSQRHTGVAGTGVRLEMQVTGQYVLDVDVPYTHLEWVEIDGNGLPDVGGISLRANADNAALASLLIHGTSGSPVTGSGVLVAAGADGAAMHNLVVYDYGGDGVHVSGLNATIANGTFFLGRTATASASVQTDAGATASVYNALAVGPETGFRENGAPGLDLHHCISTDTSACDLDVSGSCRTSVPPASEFVSPGAPVDLHLRPGAVAIDFGADLSASFTDDIDGQTRPLRAAWDVGADEAPAASGRTNYRSLGTAPSLVNQGTITVTAGSVTVTKVGGLGWLTQNRGRGDVLVVGPVPDTYTILDVVSDDELTLAAPAAINFTGTTYTIARQFTTLQGWENCISGAGGCTYFPVGTGNLVLEDRSEVGIAYRDSVFALSADVLIEGSTTDALHTITLTADVRNRHNGVPGGGVVVDGQGGPNGIVVRDDHVTLEWLELVRVRGANDKAAVLVEGAGQTSLLFQNLLVHDFFDAIRAVAGINLSTSGAGGRAVTIRNSMLWDGDEEGIQGGRNTDTLLIENCSVHDIRDAAAAGIDAAESVVTVVNTIVTGSGNVDFDPDLGSFAAASANNVSSDGSAPGTNALTAAAATVFAFLDPGPTHNHNLHLKAGGPAVDSGVDLLPTSGFQSDVDGQLRPIGPGWDRGADELGPGATDLVLTKDDGQTTAVPGTPISYVITLMNNGPDPVASVKLTDTVPASLLGASFSTANGSYSASSGVWTFTAPLSAGQSAVLTLDGTIDPGARGTLTNTAAVAPPTGYTDLVPGDNAATDVDTLAPEADLAITKTEDADPIDLGNLLVYTLTVTNAGPSDATGVLVVDTLVPDVEYQSATPTQGLCNYDGPSRTITCNPGVIAPGGSASVYLAVRPLILTTVANTASVGGNEPDPAPANNAASAMTTVIGAQSCVVTTDLAGGDDWGSGVAMQADGRIVLGGHGYRPAPGGQDFAVVRYTPDLILDGSFGTAGKAATEIDREDWANAMALQSDGRILLGGHNRVASGPPDDDFTLVRYDPAGVLDATFNPGGTYGEPPSLAGVVNTDVGGSWDVGRALVQQADGKVLLAGAARVGGTDDIGLVRYLPDGDLDPGFGTGGKVTTPVGVGDEYASALAVQPDGRIVLAGAAWNGTDWDWVIVRYDTDGGLDGSFGGGGVVVTDLQGGDDQSAAVAIQPDGKIVVMGHSYNGVDNDFAVARYDTDGSPDTTFNAAGTFGDPPHGPGRVFVMVGAGDDTVGAGVLQPDGRILAAGWAYNGQNDDFAMVRLNPDGSLDGSFGSGGRVATAIGGGGDEAHAVALQPDGRILLAGRSYNAATSNWDFALARYTPTGQLEGGCGTTRYRSIGTAPDLVDQGTITVTSGLSKVTKVGGLGWLAENRGQGDVLLVGPNTYSILDVVSDDELTLASVPAVSYTGSTYTIARQFKTLKDWGDCISGSVVCPYFPVGSGNLITDNRSEVGVAYKDSVFALTATFRLTGAKTDTLHTIALTANRRNRHNGIAGAGVVIDAQDGPFGIDVEDDYVTLEWLEIRRFRNVDYEGAITLSGGKGPRGVLLQNLLIHDFFDPTHEVDGIRLSGVGVKSITVRNTMIWDGDDYGIRGDEPFDVLTIENTSIDGIVDSGGHGIYAEDSTLKIYNTIVTGSAGDDYKAGPGTLTGSNNISSDPTAALYFANAQPGVAAGSVFIGVGDLRLKSGPNPAVDAGLDLFSSSGFRGDIEGQLRPSGAAWDLGADEFSSSALDLGLTKDDGQVTVVPGTAVSYVITVTNSGPDPVTNVTVTDPVPPAILGAFFNTSNGSYDSGTGLWTFAAPLLAGQGAILTLGGTIDPSATGTLANTATVFPPAGLTDTLSANDSDSDLDTLTPLADLGILKTDDVDPIAIGNLLTYTLTVTNAGPSTASGVVVTDTLVPEMDFESATPSQGLCNYDDPTRTLTCTLGVIAAGGGATVTLEVRPLALGTFDNTASVTAPEPDPVAGNNTATEDTTVVSSDGVLFFTVTSTFEQNVLEWLNPAGPGYGSTEILYRTDRFPTGATDPLATSIYNAGTAGMKDRLVHGAPDLTGKNGQTFYYAAFVHRTVAPLVSTGRFCTGRPFDDSGAVKWAFSTGAFSITPPTVGTAGVVAPANDRALYAMERGPAGGEWPLNWLPAQLGGVVQSRSPVVPIDVSGVNPVVYLGAQDGSVYVVNGAIGGAAAFPWAPSPIAGMVQAAPAGIFSAFWAGVPDYLLVGTRDDGADNALVALDPTSGAVLASFNNGGSPNGIGVISGMATVDYAGKRVYFASHEHPSGSTGTLWCLQLGPPGPVFTLVWQRSLGDIDGSPVVRGDRIYVGSTLGGGTVYSIDAATGNPLLDRTFVHGDGPVKEFVWPDRSSVDLYFATSNLVWAISDTGAASIPNKFAGPISLGGGVTPSPVLFVPGNHYVYVGGSDGRLYEIDVAGAAPALRSVPLGDGTATVGAPSLDWFYSLIHVGTEAGIFYAVQAAPLP